MTLKKSKTIQIAQLFFRELIRDKVFLLLSATAVLLVLATLILNEMVVGEKIKATKDLGLSILNIFSLFILIFAGVNLVSKDLSQKSLYFLFSKSVKRWQYLFGSAISILLCIVAGILVITGTVFFLSTLHDAPWFTGLITAGYLTLLEMIIILSFALLFAVFTSPQLAMFLTLLVYIIGHTIEKAAIIVEHSTNLALKYAVITAGTLLPNLELFNKKAAIIYGLEIPHSYYLNATLYSLAYALLIFLVSVYVLNKKEI
ncbi:MAG: ABC transporter permease subunit [bacterium]|nr:ABC transporter permease subunit [bacterium]